MNYTSIPKPKIGEKCNGCGLCCQIQVCTNGAFVQGFVEQFGETIPGPCPAIVKNKDGSISCGIILNPKKYIRGSKYPEDVLRRNFAHLVGSGNGCDELLENDSNEEEAKLESILDAKKSDSNWQKKTKIALKVIHGIDEI